MRWPLFAFALLAATGCRSREFGNKPDANAAEHPRTQASAPTRTSTKPQPGWISRDCTKDAEAFYFVGYGEGRNQAAATQQALIEARKNALLCVFGGAIEFSSETRESNKDVSLAGKTKVRVTSDNVEWTGFEKVLGHDHFPFEERDAVYVMYRWPLDKIDTSKKKLAQLQEQIEKNKALATQVEATKAIVEEKSDLIDKQRKELESLKQQELELEKLQDETARRVSRLSGLKKTYEGRVQSYEQIVKSMPCGIKVREVIAVLGKPTKAVPHLIGNLYWNARLFWGDLNTEINRFEISNCTGSNTIRSGIDPMMHIENCPVKWFNLDNGATGRKHSLCRGS